ncbi:MAG: hypothetical protein QW734_04445 [Candidatus Bathyarchaeia archaeon]
MERLMELKEMLEARIGLPRPSFCELVVKLMERNIGVGLRVLAGYYNVPPPMISVDDEVEGLQHRTIILSPYPQLRAILRQFFHYLVCVKQIDVTRFDKDLLAEIFAYSFCNRTSVHSDARLMAIIPSDTQRLYIFAYPNPLVCYELLCTLEKDVQYGLFLLSAYYDVEIPKLGVDLPNNLSIAELLKSFYCYAVEKKGFERLKRKAESFAQEIMARAGSVAPLKEEYDGT